MSLNFDYTTVPTNNIKTLGGKYGFTYDIRYIDLPYAGATLHTFSNVPMGTYTFKMDGYMKYTTIIYNLYYLTINLINNTTGDTNMYYTKTGPAFNTNSSDGILVPMTAGNDFTIDRTCTLTVVVRPNQGATFSCRYVGSLQLTRIA